jgi:hypothetical protein
MVRDDLEVICDELVKSMGACYVYPQGEYMTDTFSGNKIENPYFGQTPTPVYFGFGTKKELNIFLNDNVKKYPLIWLSYPFEEEFMNDYSQLVNYKKVRFLFATNNTVDKLVQNRVLTTKMVLNQIIKKFLSILKNGYNYGELVLPMEYRVIKKFYPNYGISNTKYDSNPKSENQRESSFIDIWDAFTLDLDLIHQKEYC